MPDLGSINKVILLGYLGKDPELQTNLNTDSKFTVLDVATKEYFAKVSGKNPETTWHKCVAWGRTAEIVCQYGKKGTLVAIEGRIKKKSWQTKEGGDKRKSFEILVNNLTIVGGKMRDFEDEPRDRGVNDEPY